MVDYIFYLCVDILVWLAELTGTTYELVNIIKCSFSNCITQNEREPLPNKMVVVNKHPVEIRCFYCGKIQDVTEITEHII